MQNPLESKGPCVGVALLTDEQSMPPQARTVKLETPLDYALWFAREHGAYVFPITANAKSPPLGSWTLNSTNVEETILARAEMHPHCNWGLDLYRSGLVALDVDNKTDERKGTLDMARLCFALDIDPEAETLSVATVTNDGRHYLYKGRCGSRYAKLDGENLSVDVRSDGRYIVLAGSRIVDDQGDERVYRIINDKPIAEAPPAVLALGGSPREDRKNAPRRQADGSGGGMTFEPDNSSNVAEAVEWLSEAAPIAEPGGRNATCYAVAARLRGLGVSEAATSALMVNVWNRRLSAPLDAAEVHATTTHAFMYAAGEPGAEATPTFEGVAIPWDHYLLNGSATPARPGHLHVDLSACRAARFLAGPPPIPEMLFKDSLTLGDVGLLAGAGGLGKSFYALQMAVAVSGGFDAPLGCLLTLADPTPSKCFALFSEDSETVVAQRLHAVLDTFCSLDPGLGDDPAQVRTRREAVSENLHILSGVGANMRLQELRNGQPKPSPFYRHLRDILSGVDGLKLVILDNISRLFSGVENSNEHAALFSELLESLAKETGASVIALHHTAKPGAAKAKGYEAISDRLASDRTRGASAFVNSVRWQLSLGQIRPEESRYVGAEPDDAWRYIAAGVSKINNGRGAGVRFLCRDAHSGVLRAHVPTRPEAPGLDALMAKIADVLPTMEPMTVPAFARRASALWRGDQPRFSERMIRDGLEVLLHEGRLRTVPHKNEGNRHNTMVLALPEPQA